MSTPKQNAAILGAVGVLIAALTAAGISSAAPAPAPSATVTDTSTPTVSTSPTDTVTPSPSPTVTTVPPRVFPDASTTGWQHTGVTLTPSGPITVTVAGTVLDSLDITGGVVVKANNVTISRSRITGGAYWTVRVYGGFTGTTISDTQLVGVNTAGGALPRCDGATSGNGLTILRVDVSNCADLLDYGAGTTVTDSYLHDPFHSATTHNDGIQISSGSNYTIRHNTILMGHIENSATFIKADFGNINNVTIDNNYLDGGSYTVFGGDVAATATAPAKLVTNVFITNNVFGNSALYGKIYTTRMTGPVTITGNVDVNGVPVP